MPVGRVGMKLILSLFIYLTVFSYPIAAYAKDIKFHATVGVDVSGNDSVKNRVVSYVGRELRSLGDVTVANDHPDYELSLIVLKTSNIQGFNTGYTIGTSVSTKFYNQYVVQAAQQKYKKVVSSSTSNLYIFTESYLNTGSPKELRKICRQIVANFDTDVLQKQRDMVDKLNKMMDNKN